MSWRAVYTDSPIGLNLIDCMQWERVLMPHACGNTTNVTDWESV